MISWLFCRPPMRRPARTWRTAYFTNGVGRAISARPCSTNRRSAKRAGHHFGERLIPGFGAQVPQLDRRLPADLGEHGLKQFIDAMALLVN